MTVQQMFFVINNFIWKNLENRLYSWDFLSLELNFSLYRCPWLLVWPNPPKRLHFRTPRRAFATPPTNWQRCILGVQMYNWNVFFSVLLLLCFGLRLRAERGLALIERLCKSGVKAAHYDPCILSRRLKLNIHQIKWQLSTQIHFRRENDIYSSSLFLFKTLPLHTSYLSFFLHWQNFWKMKFTPKNANFSR